MMILCVKPRLLHYNVFSFVFLFFLMVETSTLAPPFNGYWVQGHFPFVKRPEREIDHLALMPRLRISGATLTLSPAVFSWRGQGQFQSNAHCYSRKSLSHTLQNKYTEIKLHSNASTGHDVYVRVVLRYCSGHDVLLRRRCWAHNIS